MKPTTRLGALLLSLALVLALAGCGAKEAATPPEQIAPALDTVQDDAAASSEHAPEASVSPLPSMTEPTKNATEVGENAAEDGTAAAPSAVGADESDTESAALTCTMSISCAALLRHTDTLDPEKLELVPADGLLLPASVLSFEEGESVFDLLKRVCRENKLHIEFSETPVYGSAYIEGIGNLYEFDCGEGSGWMYRVNGAFPQVGCSQNRLHAGDTVEWLYTCDFGADIGGREVSP